MQVADRDSAPARDKGFGNNAYDSHDYETGRRTGNVGKQETTGAEDGLAEIAARAKVVAKAVNARSSRSSGSGTRRERSLLPSQRREIIKEQIKKDIKDDETMRSLTALAMAKPEQLYKGDLALKKQAEQAKMRVEIGSIKTAAQYNRELVSIRGVELKTYQMLGKPAKPAPLSVLESYEIPTVHQLIKLYTYRKITAINFDHAEYSMPQDGARPAAVWPDGETEDVETLQAGEPEPGDPMWAGGPAMRKSGGGLQDQIIELEMELAKRAREASQDYMAKTR
ncbi:MAG: hypothetical protein LBO78_02110 [Rickettsiales bacterium]|jgi:hypothetical protein|nr:hypothetical protein [Rickettsiales bacterium]